MTKQEAIDRLPSFERALAVGLEIYNGDRVKAKAFVDGITHAKMKILERRYSGVPQAVRANEQN